MLSPSEYDRLCDQIITLYDDLDNAIISDITRRIVKTGRMTETAKWQAKQLQESGLLYDDIISEIANRTDATGQHVRTLFEDSGVQAVRNDNRHYRAAGLEGIVKMSDAALQTLYAGYVRCGGDLQNLTLTTAGISQTAYINACNQAYMQVTSGAFSYQEAIRNAVKKSAQNGTYVQYPTGHRDRLDVAVRRSVLTGVGQTVRQISLINANDMGCDLMEITAHSGARPSHAQWQGQLVSLSGRRGYLSLKDIGYGTGDGFGGWNCRHDWFPFFEGISTPAYTARQLAEFDEKCIEYNGVKYSEYEISQIQRKIEREIRSAKREQVAFKVAVEEAEDPELEQVMLDSLNYVKSLLKKRQAKMRDFIKQTGQDRDYFREQNYPKENIKNSLTSSNNYSIINKSTYFGNLTEKFGRIKNIFADKLTPDKYKKVSHEYLDSLPRLNEHETILQSLKATNPNNYTENCQRCVPAYEMRRRGYNTIAVDAPENDTIGLYDFRKIFTDSEWKVCNGSGKREIIEFLSNSENGTRIEISIITRQGSHLFCAEKTEGRIIFLDPQIGEVNVERYFDYELMDNTSFCRIDNLDLSNLIKDCIEVGE